MPYRFTRYLVLLSCLAGCSSENATSSTVTATQQGTPAHPHISLTNLKLIKGSDYVMYPLTLSETITEGYGGSYSSESRVTDYWNIVFYNAKSGESHLLSEAKRLLILSYSDSESDNSDDNLSKEKPHTNAADDLLYYSVISDDFNHDGKLTSDDATYLFVSDKSGSHFRQISPDSLHVSSWHIQQTTGKILLQTTADSNHDRRFADADEHIPYIYDVATGQPAARVISSDAAQQLILKFQQQWPQKP
jgi:hypothetical protein